MIRVLFIARYRDKTMWRKVELIAQQPDLQVRFVFPAYWQDDLTKLVQKESTSTNFEQIPISFIGSPSEPHRTFYRSIGVGCTGFNPTIIHTEEEPDSLAALQIAVARRIFAPKAKLLLHTWQNVERPKTSYVNWVMNRTLTASDCVMCANQTAIDLLHARGYRKLTPLLPPIGVDTTVFFPSDNPIEDTEVKIAYIGRLSLEKDISTLLHAFAELRTKNKSSLHLIGNGPERSKLEQLAKDIGIEKSSHFIGALSLVEIAEKLRQIDILVLPSRSTPVWQEQFGRVLTEAMASKVVVVGSSSGAIPEVIGDAGKIFPEGDVATLTTTLQTLIDSPEMRYRLALQGYQRVNEHYTQERIAEKTVDLYRQLLTL